ncbi:MAG: hypothetical protein ABF264_01515 [Flavobacteriales bacterium]|jgi:hypothetical protein
MGILTDIGNYEYHCPHCKENLREKEGIEFFTKNEEGNILSIFLDPNLGKYDFYYDYSHNFKQGEKVDFYCPDCNHSLQSSKHFDYVEVLMIVSKDVKFEVLFSRIYGVKRTYLVMEDYVEKHGENMLDFDELYEL